MLVPNEELDVIVRELEAVGTVLTPYRHVTEEFVNTALMVEVEVIKSLVQICGLVDETLPTRFTFENDVGEGSVKPGAVSSVVKPAQFFAVTGADDDKDDEDAPPKSVSIESADVDSRVFLSSFFTSLPVMDAPGTEAGMKLQPTKYTKIIQSKTIE
jgi:hypothetical protein